MYKELVENLRKCSRDKDTYKNTLFREAADAIEDLVEQMEVMDAILNIFNERENRKKYLKYWRKKNDKSDLSYPDGDEVYKEFWELKNRVAELEKEDMKLRKKIADCENEDSWKREAEMKQYMGCE